MVLPLREYQVADLAFMIGNERAGLLHDPGGGKTPPVCVLLYYLWSEGKEKSIWVMPKQLMRKNKQELLRFTHFEDRDVAIVDGPKSRDALKSDAKVFIMGPARFSIIWQELISAQPAIRALAADEVHMYWATHDRAGTSSLYAAMKHLRRFIPMTGTLIKGRLSSAYPTFHAIEPRYYPSFQAFMNYHAVKNLDNQVVAWKNVERIIDIVGRHFIKRSFESIYGAENKVIQTELCPMGPKQREAYDEFEERAILELENEFLTGSNGVFALRCRQIMSHPETWGIADGQKTGKDEILEVHLADHAQSNEPVVLYAWFKPEQERIAGIVRKMGMSCAILNGDTPVAKRAQIDQDFCAGRLQVIVGSPQVATVGYNWQDIAGNELKHMIFVSIGYEDDVLIQAMRRGIRGVRKTPLRVTVLEYEKSIDQRMMSIIRQKSILANKIDPSREILELSVNQ